MDGGVENTELGASAKFGSGPIGDLGRNKSEVQEGTIWGLGVSPVAWARVVHRASGCRVESPQSRTSAHRSLWISQEAGWGFYTVSLEIRGPSTRF